MTGGLSGAPGTELAFCVRQDPGRHVALVVGPGGVGKSRLIRQFGLDMSRPGPQAATVLFAAADTPVEPAQLEQLPDGRNLAVVVEDAHARPDAAAIVQGVVRRNPARTS